MHANRGEFPPAGSTGSSGDLTRWALCLAFALACHAAAAAVLVARWDATEALASAPPILVELAPLAVAPAAEPVEVAPGPQQNEASAAPAESAPPREEDAPMKAEPQPPKPSIEQPVKQPAPRRHAARTTSAPSPAERRDVQAAAPAPAVMANSSALPNWRSSLLARLERTKRYPAEAQARGERGVALLAFSVDRAGGVHHARIARSSGSAALDRETLSLPERAQPLPPPPAELTGTQVAVTVPVRYDMH